MSTILIVEDDSDLVKELTEILSEEGYYVLAANNGAEAIIQLQRQPVDLCLLDIGLPDCSGFDLCEKIRMFCKNPIIILTACDTEENIISGLRKGADDYITKPFSINILLSRLDSQLRRKEWETTDSRNVLFSGDLEIDFDKRKILRQKEEIPLRSVEFDICGILLRSNGNIVKRDLILDGIWDSKNKFVEDNTLSVHLSRLRKQLGSYNGDTYIKTVKGVGYCWNIRIIKN